MEVSLTLASGSAARQNMLRAAGYDFDIKPADIDEEKIIIERKQKDSLKNIPLVLAKEKAKLISNKFSNSYIIGSDQILVSSDNVCSKVKNMEEAKKRINELQGKTHRLISAVCVFKNNKELFSCVDEAHLTMRSLNDHEIEQYCNKAGDVLMNCVGCYALESIGIRLFHKIEGSYFTILGMPLLPLSNFLDSEGFGL